MKTIAKLYKEYRSIFEMSAISCLLALLLVSTLLVLYVDSAKADTQISSDCVYYDEEKTDDSTKVCYYDCDNGTQNITVEELSKCPFTD
jgi:hypothetical protein